MTIVDLSPALLTGLAAIDTAIGKTADEHSLTYQAMARGLMRGYDAHWWQPGVDDRVLAIEREFRCSLWNLAATKRQSKSRTWEVAGKIDLEVERKRKLWIVDHKTTSEDIDDLDGVYWRQLQVDGQVNLYLLAKHYEGRDVAGAIWDVIRKPGIRPKKLTKAEQKMATSLGTYLGQQISETSQQALLKDARETAELFELRVTSEVTDNPTRYYQRKPVLRLEHEIATYAEELWKLAKEILAERRSGLPVRNSGACLNDYGTPCQFLGICSGHDTPHSANWVLRAKVHEELSIEDGLNVLTHSRLRCFQTCKRKHYYRYEFGIERADRQRSDAAWFGTIMHHGLSAWWSTFLCPTAQQETVDVNSNADETTVATEANGI